MRYKIKPILTLLCSAAVLPLPASAQIQSLTPIYQLSDSDQAVLKLNTAYRRGDKALMAALLPQTQGNPLEPWAAYWELKARLKTAQPAEVDAFLQRYQGSYQEDRLRNDWLLLLGKQHDWTNYKRLRAAYRMNDDPQIQCYDLLMQRLDQGNNASANSANIPAEVARRWQAARNDEDGCTMAAGLLIATREMPESEVWRKARLAVESNKPDLAAQTVEMVTDNLGGQVNALMRDPARYLATAGTATDSASKELAVLALVRLANSNEDNAAALMQSTWAQQLTDEQRAWAWGQIGKQSALSLSNAAVGYFSQVPDSALNDDHLAWKTRAALRAGQWQQVKSAIEAMQPQTRKDSTWVYWHARALQALGQPDAQREFASIAGPDGFYEMLAQEALGRPITLPPAPAAVTASERSWALRQPSLQRAIHAIDIGLRSEGVREWNYAVALAQPGGMPDRELLAAASIACDREIWDRCINTSERTKGVFDVRQRFPMPLQDLVVPRSQTIGLDPAYVYGLIRQESRFVTHARSGVGASGLMQVMPATARWTARKIGMTNFSPSRINERDVNVTIGTAYLKLALDDFDGSMAMASAAYNAGPGRPRNWRAPGGIGPTLEGAIWAENIPFSETRDYVKKVLGNTTMYAALLHESSQSLQARLGTIGPRPAAEGPDDVDLP